MTGSYCPRGMFGIAETSQTQHEDFREDEP